MNNTIHEIVARIGAFDNSRDNLLQLDEDAMTLFESGRPELHLDLLFSLFERFPNEENEVFWGIMHGLEHLPNYESALVESTYHQASSMGVLMINRLLNSGENQVGGVGLLELLQAVAANFAAPEAVRSWAQDFAIQQLHKL